MRKRHWIISTYLLPEPLCEGADPHRRPYIISQPFLSLMSFTQASSTSPQPMLPVAVDGVWENRQPVRSPPSNGPSETGYSTLLPSAAIKLVGSVSEYMPCWHGGVLCWAISSPSSRSAGCDATAFDKRWAGYRAARRVDISECTWYSEVDKC